jgi:hypothetical protein
MGDSRANARVRQGLEKCVAKIEKNQLKDGSWNISGEWAPIVGTSMASQSLFIAQQKGVAVQLMAMARIEQYTQVIFSGRFPLQEGAGARTVEPYRGGPQEEPGREARRSDSPSVSSAPLRRQGIDNCSRTHSIGRFSGDHRWLVLR